MCISFLRNEVINFLSYHALFSLSLQARTTYLFENGIINQQSCEHAKQAIFNNDIFDNYKPSPLLKNRYLETKIEQITGNKIKIIDHPDSGISGVACACCQFVVFKNAEDAIFEICPVCNWQTDTLDKNGYSKLNKSYLTDYKNNIVTKELIEQYSDVFIRRYSPTSLKLKQV